MREGNTTWSDKTRRRMALAVYACAVVALCAGIWHSGYVQALGQLEQRGHSDLRLAADRLTRDLKRVQELAVLFAEHPSLQAAHDRNDNVARSTANSLLQEAVDKTSAQDLVYVDRYGEVLAAAGQVRAVDLPNLPATRYFRRAMNGALGAHHVVRGDEQTRYFLFAAPSFGADGKVQAALIVSVDVDQIEFEWRGGNPAVFFTDAQGVIFVSNRTDMHLWTVDGAASDPDARFFNAHGEAQEKWVQMVRDKEIWHINWGPYLPTRSMHLTFPLPVIGLTGEALIDVAPAQRIAALQALVAAALCLALGTMLFLFAERRRVLAAQNEELEARVARRTAALKRAQADLVRAGKLSALGQMSAGISHELNQPLMAIRSFAENGQLFLDRGRADEAAGNFDRISDLARRMGRIIKNLRAFARNESEAIENVDIAAIVQSALDLSAARLKADEITLHWEMPNTAIWVHGGEVRLGQVLLNLMTNACDAMSGCAMRALTVGISQEGGKVTVTIMDTGPGIAEPDKIFDPFYSTKEVSTGEGMGLGLSISYGLVQNFGGDIRGSNRSDGQTGAIFTVHLEAAPPREIGLRQEAAE